MKKIILLFLKYYLPAIFWAGLIFYFSSVPNLRYSSEVTLEVILRKGAHLFEYIVLAWLIFRIFYAGHMFSFWKSFFAAFALGAVYGISDEYHQTFILGRAGRADDAIYDIVSIFIGLLLLDIYTRRKVAWKIFLALSLAILALLGLEYEMIKEGKKIEQESFLKFQPSIDLRGRIIEEPPEEKNPSKTLPEQEKAQPEIPKKMLIRVPFTSQAPHKIWDEYHGEACEEASLVMVKYHLDKKALNPDIAEKDIQGLIAYQIKNYGDYKDTDAEKTKQLAEDYFGMKNLRVVYDFAPEDIKKYLSRGNPIILPVAGRELGNPNFKSPGPLYHVLVIVGYDGDTIITNDPGTRKGEGYKYDLKILYSSVHDFPGRPEDILKGRKAMIVIEP